MSAFVYLHPRFFRLYRYVWTPSTLIGCLRLLPLLFLFHAGAVSAAAISVTVDRESVPINESFTLIFSAEETPDADPDFTPLEKDFHILGQSQSSQISLINGRFSRRTEWHVSVMARQEGTLTVPSIAFGSDRSKPLTIHVSGSPTPGVGASGEDLFLEVEAEPKNPYVQAQVIYTVRVLSRVHFGGANLSEPSSDDALIQKLGDDRRYTTYRNGLQYTAIERKYAVFPQKSGTLLLEPLTLEARRTSAGQSLFNQFFNHSARILRAHSDSITLDVRPIPTAFSGEHWLPAEHLEIEDSWSQDDLKTTAGEPITRTITVRADGTTVGLLPELAPKAAGQSPSDIKRYPDQPLLNEQKLASGLASVRQEKIALIPARSGTYRLPPIEIPWWNTKTDRMEIARLPERILTALPGAQTEETAPSAVAAASPEPSSAAAQTPIEAPRAGGGAWFWLALLFGLGWLGTAAAWWLSRKPRKPEVLRPADDPRSERSAVNALRMACQKNDPAAARQALLDWARLRWPSARPIGLDELKSRCRGELGREIERLNRALYRHPESGWQGQMLWSAFRSDPIILSSRDKPAIAANLEPLYKL
ncbi:BatD family protein [Methylocaldum szegediense]|uniref:Oxygen tolerance protein BatD n=1 Tax=Methylocaldum szegediense TaxID=73780 RepID=A0ABN8X800_9GAMM|nr:BatD family protein [Methylocaldum szegediense]CAI8886618.1 Oxygen tolerance protein BatD [Methylocaldum szegediense]